MSGEELDPEFSVDVEQYCEFELGGQSHIGYYDVEWILIEPGSYGDEWDEFTIAWRSERLGVQMTYAELDDLSMTADNLKGIISGDLWGCYDVAILLYPYGFYDGRMDVKTSNDNVLTEEDKTCWDASIQDFNYCYVELGDPGNMNPNTWVDLTQEVQGTSGAAGFVPEARIMVIEPCKLTIEHLPLVIDAITTNVEDCETYLSVETSGGMVDFNDVPANAPCSTYGGQQEFPEYRWKAFDINDEDQEIDIFLNNDGLRKCIAIDGDHPYFENFSVGGFIEFICEVEVEDHAGLRATSKKVITIHPPFRVDLPDEVTRCPGAETPISDSPFVINPPINAEYAWTATDPQLFDFTDPENPVIKIPSGYSSSAPVFVQLSVTDLLTGCSREGNFTLIVSGLVADAGPATIKACIGPSIQQLGQGAETATGGSGNYTYVWSPIDYLDDPNLPTPTVSEFESLTPIEYTLIVSDEYGCTDDDMTVVGTSSSSPTVDITPDGYEFHACYGTDFDLSEVWGVSVVTGGYVIGSYVYSWETTLDGFEGSNDPNLVIPGHLLRHPKAYSKTYPLTLTVSDSENGCFDREYAGLVVNGQWQYKGYESRIYFEDGNGRGDLWDGTVNDNRIYTVNDLPDFDSGAVPPFLTSWLEPIPYNDRFPITGYNNVPAAGEFNTSDDFPLLTMRVKDQYGCTKDFRTNRILPRDGDPELEVILISPQSPAICHDGQICFLVKLKTNYNGRNYSLLPSSIETGYDIEHHQFNGGQSSIESGVIELDLVNALEGVYAAQFCYDADVSFPTTQYYVFAVSGELECGADPVDNEPFSGRHQFFVGHETNSSAIKDICVDDQYEISLGVNINPDNCANDLVLVGDSPAMPLGKYQWRGGLEGFVTVDGYTTDIGGLVNYLHAFIDPCVSENFAPDDPEEKLATMPPPKIREPIPDNINLKVHPNPFSGGVEITYSILSENNAEIVNINIMDTTGRIIAVLTSDEIHTTGIYSINFMGDDLPSGLYFVNMSVGGQQSLSQKMVKVK